MKKLDTIQSIEKLNNVYSVDGGIHSYRITPSLGDEDLAIIKFQNGPRYSDHSFTGVIDSDLLEIVKHRLEFFQQGPYECHYNDVTLYHITRALESMNHRIEDRYKRNVLGTFNK